MKHFGALPLAAFAALSVLTACTYRDHPPSEPESPPAVESSAPVQESYGVSELDAPDILEAEKAPAMEPPEGFVPVSFSVPRNDEFTVRQEERMEFNMYLPADWTTQITETVTELYSDYHVGDIAPVRLHYNDANPFEDSDFQYGDDDNMRDFTAGSYGGRYYHVQYELEEGGMTALQNELVYCLHVEDSILTIVFYPMAGMGGIGPQRELFDSIAQTIEVTSRNY